MRRKLRLFAIYLYLFVTLISFNNCGNSGFTAKISSFEEQNSTGTVLSCLLPTGAVPVGSAITGYPMSTAVFPMACGNTVTRTCLPSGQFDGSIPLADTCNQQCRHPDTNQAVNSATAYVYFSRNSGTQVECDSAKITSICQSSTGQFLPTISQNRFPTCLVAGQTCAYTVSAETSVPSGNNVGATVSGYKLSTATYPTLCEAQVIRTCQTNGNWTGTTPLYATCIQKCIHPETGMPENQGSSFIYFTRSSGTQTECNAAKVTSMCSAATGTYSPAVQPTRYMSCSVVTSPIIVNFSANVTSIQSGQTAILSWTVINATSLTLSSVGDVIGKTSQSVTPSTTTTYTLTALSNAGTVSKSLTIEVTAIPNPSADVTITIDSGKTFQKMDGFGSSLRVFDDPHVTETFNPATRRGAVVIPPAEQDKILKLLHQDMGFSIVRPVFDGNVEPINDNADPSLIDFTKFDFTWKSGDAHIDYIKKVQPMGVDNFWLSPVVQESWMSSTNPTEWVEHCMAHLTYWKSKGLELPYFSILNEPSYVRSGIRSGEYLRDAIKLLGPKMTAAGMKTKLVIADDVRASDAARISQIILADPDARKYVSAIATHLYDESVSNMQSLKSLGAQYNLPVWMTEFSITGMSSAGYSNPNYLQWSLLMHDLISNYNVSAIMYMWGFFGQWDGPGAKLIQINYSGTNYSNFSTTKELYATGQFSRFVRPGFLRTQAVSTDNNVKVTSYVSGSTVTVVVINDSNSNRSAQFNLGGVANPQYFGVRTSESESFSKIGSFAVSNSSFQTVLPSKSITTVTSDITRLP